LLSGLGSRLTTNNGKDVSCGNIHYIGILKNNFRFLPSILDISEIFQHNKFYVQNGGIE